MDYEVVLVELAKLRLLFPLSTHLYPIVSFPIILMLVYPFSHFGLDDAFLLVVPLSSAKWCIYNSRNWCIVDRCIDFFGNCLPKKYHHLLSLLIVPELVRCQVEGANASDFQRVDCFGNWVSMLNGPLDSKVVVDCCVFTAQMCQLLLMHSIDFHSIRWLLSYDSATC